MMTKQRSLIEKMRTRATYFFCLCITILFLTSPIFGQTTTEPQSTEPQATDTNVGSPTDQDETQGRAIPGSTDWDVDGNAIRKPAPQNQPANTQGEPAEGTQQKKAAEAPICPGPKCPQLAPEPKTEFQKFIFTTTGQRLAVYGHNLFEVSPSTFAPVNHIPVPADYVVGPGDELLIRAWGQVEFNAKITVDRNGQVYVPRVGAVNVSGIRYDRLTDYLKGEIGRVFKNFDLNVTLGQLRSIQVFVVGQARRPGTYTISSLSTLVTALFASGGPNATGSMRHIQLKRNNQIASEFDVYDLLGKGDKSRDTTLLPGDVIYIPPVAEQVAVIGSVNLPAIYEIDDKTTIRDVIAAAGGLSTIADGSHLILERIQGRETRNIEEIKLDESGLAQTLHDGDVLRVFPISPRVGGSVILRGSVAVPGRYPWREDMRVSDLIPSKEILITREYWMRQTTFSRGETGWKNPEPTPVPNSSDKGWSDGRLVSDKTQIIRNPTEINWDYAVIQRLNRQDLSSELLTFNLGNAIEDHASKDNVVLQAGDVITIFSQADLAVPAEKRTKFVWIEGEVKAPGIYRVQQGETLRDLVVRAGGLTPSAYLFASEFTRVSTKIEQQKEMNQLIESAERDLRSRARLSTAGLTADEKTAAQEELQYERAAIDKLRTVQVSGRLVLELKPTDNQVSDLPAVNLEDGDQFLVPAIPATVGVVGAVYNQSSFLYQPQRNTVSRYLTLAGGGTREADSSRLFIVRANGSVVSKQSHRSIWSGGFDGTSLFPGDAIVMPERVKTTNVLRGLRDWSQVFAQFALGVAALKTISP